MKQKLQVHGAAFVHTSFSLQPIFPEINSSSDNYLLYIRWMPKRNDGKDCLRSGVCDIISLYDAMNRHEKLFHEKVINQYRQDQI